MSSDDRQMQPLPPSALVALFVLCAVVALGTIAAAARFALTKESYLPEFAQAGDTFGYLEMAKDIQEGAAPHGLPRFTFDSKHSRLLLKHFSALGVPVEKYGPMLVPDAYNYRPATGLMVNQYPPGVGLLLALFPRGHAMHVASYAVAWLLLAFGVGVIGVLVWQGVRGGGALAVRGAAIGAVALAVIIGLLMLGVSVSYSIDLFCLPLLLNLACVRVAMRREGALAWAAAGIGGALFGYAVLSRIAAILFLPGFLLLLCPMPLRGGGGGKAWKRFGKAGLFAAATVACGVVPLMIHQAALTGSPFRSTYSAVDTRPLSLGAVPGHLAYYLAGEGSAFVVLTLAAVVAFGMLLLGRRRSARETVAWGRLSRFGWALLLFWGVPTAFFLAHPVTTDYYQYPTILTILFVICFAMLDATTAAAREGAALFDPRVAGIACGVLLGAAGVYASALPTLTNPDSLRVPKLEVPAILKDPNAWIFGDRFTGTMWYYFGMPATQLRDSDPAVRWQALEFITKRGDPIFLLYDNPALDPVIEEMYGRGARFYNVGSFGAEPVLWVKMPGAATIPALRGIQAQPAASGAASIDSTRATTSKPALR